jgi:tetratricopeptide (TPR) repeat protein
MKSILATASICALLLCSGCTQSPEKLVAAGNRYHDKKKYKEASILYQKAISKDKTNAEAYYRQGINLTDDHNYAEAAKYLRRAVDLKPDNTDAESRLAEIYLTAYASDPKKFKPLLPEITDMASKILQHDSNSFAGLRLQALLDLAQGNTDQALQNFAKANQVKPNSPELVGWYAEALVKAQRPQEAEALVRQTLAHDGHWGPGYDFLFLLYSRQNQRDKAEAVLRERVQRDSSNPVALQNLANYLLATNRYADAEAVIKRVGDEHKTFPSGRQILGDFYFRAKKYDQALQQYQAGVKDDPKNALGYQERMIGVYNATGRRDDALRLAKTLATENPKNPAANEMYASLLLQTGSKTDLAKALNDLKALVQNTPGDAELHFDLARAYFNLDEKDKALNEALDAIQNEAKRQPPRPGVLFGARLVAARIYEDQGQHQKALDQVGSVLDAQPKNAEGRLIKSRALIAIGQGDRAQGDLESLVQENPQMNDARLQLANLYLSEKQYDKAAAEFDHVWKSNPPDTRGFIGLQTVKLSQGHGKEAIQALEDLVAKNPKMLAYRYELAGFQATAGSQIMRTDPEQAKQLFQQAADNYKEILKTTANSADIWLRLGLLQRQLGQYDAALASFEQASSADPRHADSILNAGMLLEQLGKKKEAVEAYNKALGIDPDNPLALNNLAFLDAQDRTNLDQAMTFAERAKKRVPNSPDISDTLGFVYYQKDLNAQALQIFREIVQGNPHNATFRLHLAMALSKQGDKQAARDEAEKALKDASQPDEQSKIRSFVSQLG